MDNKDKTQVSYKINTRCKNCGNKQDEHIPMGIAIISDLPNRKCNYCGCNELKTYHPKPTHHY